MVSICVYLIDNHLVQLLIFVKIQNFHFLVVSVIQTDVFQDLSLRIDKIKNVLKDQKNQ